MIVYTNSSLDSALKALDLKGFNFAFVPDESSLRRKGKVLVIRNDKIFAYSETLDEGIELVRDYLAAKAKLKKE